MHHKEHDRQTEKQQHKRKLNSANSSRSSSASRSELDFINPRAQKAVQKYKEEKKKKEVEKVKLLEKKEKETIKNLLHAKVNVGKGFDIHRDDLTEDDIILQQIMGLTSFNSTKVCTLYIYIYI